MIAYIIAHFTGGFQLPLEARAVVIVLETCFWCTVVGTANNILMLVFPERK